MMKMHKPMLALTFDDGPTEHTTRILDALEKNNAKATFFVLGSLVEKDKKTVERAYKMGNEILPHTWTHPHLPELTPNDITKELTDTRNIICTITGDCKFMYRPPYGEYNDIVTETSAKLGYSLINWSIDPLDWDNKNADIIFDRVMENLHDNAMTLSHAAYD
jgi:peptidoglycan/xylan/chitin deacetylase (PgdA/CDA1 family)